MTEPNHDDVLARLRAVDPVPEPVSDPTDGPVRATLEEIGQTTWAAFAEDIGLPKESVTPAGISSRTCVVATAPSVGTRTVYRSSSGADESFMISVNNNSAAAGLPPSTSACAYWRLLASGRDAVTGMPEGRAALGPFAPLSCRSLAAAGTSSRKRPHTMTGAPREWM